MTAVARSIHRSGPIAWFDRLLRRPPRRALRSPAVVPQRCIAANALLRVHRGRNGHWCVRYEDGPIKAVFAARLAAIEFARLLGMSAGSYRILFETVDGDLLEERFVPR
jgi:hypothetical protein